MLLSEIAAHVKRPLAFMAATWNREITPAPTMSTGMVVVSGAELKRAVVAWAGSASATWPRPCPAPRAIAAAALDGALPHVRHDDLDELPAKAADASRLCQSADPSDVRLQNVDVRRELLKLKMCRLPLPISDLGRDAALRKHAAQLGDLSDELHAQRCLDKEDFQPLGLSARDHVGDDLSATARQP